MKSEPYVAGQLAISARIRDAAVTALRDAADQRTRVARKASAEVLADDRDPRTASVRIVKLLGEAADLETLANTLDKLTTTEEPSMVPPPTDSPLEAGATAADVVVIPAGGDGTSAEAQRLAALAGLDDTVLGEDDLDDVDPDGFGDAVIDLDVAGGIEVPEDPETNELPEDLLDVDGDGTPEDVVVDLDTPAEDETP